MSTAQQLAPSQTPAPLRHASADNETGVLQDMSLANFTCQQYLENAAGETIAGPIDVTPTVPVEIDGVLINHFLVEMPLSMADKLTTQGDDVTTYRWYSVVTNSTDPRRDPKSDLLLVARKFGDLQESYPVGVSSDVASSANQNTSIFNRSNPAELPERSPTDEELKALALIGEYWLDQRLPPGKPEVPSNLRVFTWVRQQPDQVRNAINALIKRVIELTDDAEASLEAVAVAYQSWSGDQPDAANSVELWIKSTATQIYERDFGDTFLTSFDLAHTVSEVGGVTVIDNTTNKPISIDVDWLTTPGRVAVGPYATAPALNQMHLIVQGK